MRTILITGGAGFIGSHLCEKMLVNGDYHIICLDNFSDYYAPEIKRQNISVCMQNSRFELVEGDIRDLSALIKIAERVKIDTVVHLAARPGVIPSVERPDATFDNNVRGTQNIFETCRMMNIPRVILASSSSVYGDRSDVPFREDDKTMSPQSPYAASKIMTEMMAHAYCSVYGIECVVLRFFTVYGPRQRPDMAIHTFVRKVLSDKTLQVYGQPDSARDYTYIDDIINGVIAAIDYPTRYDIFNLGNSSPTRLDSLVDIIIQTTGINIDVEWLPARTGDVRVTYADINKAIRLLRYEPRVKITEGISRFVEWYRKEKHARQSNK